MTLLARPTKLQNTQNTTSQPQVIRRLIEATMAHDPWSGRHHLAVRRLAMGLGQYLELDLPEIERIGRVALLHDIGKLTIPSKLLNKRQGLTDDEFEKMQSHCIAGEKILQRLGGFEVEALCVRHHHERWDGQGYPDGLAGEEIPVVPRVIHLAETIDVMLNPRPYKQPCRVEHIINELGECADSQFDPWWAERTIRWIASGGLSVLKDLDAA